MRSQLLVRIGTVVFSAVAALSWCVPSAHAIIMIGVPTNHVGMVNLTGCGANRGTVTLNPDPVVHLAVPAARGLLDNTFTADAAQYPGWTLNFAPAALNGNLAITTYSAINDGGCSGGANMNATYAPAAGEPAGLTFLQLFMSNAPGAGGGNHIDPVPNDDTEPMYYTAAERRRFGLNFRDVGPRDTCAAPCNITSQFDTYLVSFNAANTTVTVFDGWMWGYNLVVVPRRKDVPEPTGLILLVSSLVLFGLVRIARGGSVHSKT